MTFRSRSATTALRRRPSFASGSLFGAVLALGLGCAPGETGTGDGGTELTEWLGEDAHFRATGTLDGEDLDLSLEGDAAGDQNAHGCVPPRKAPIVARGRNASTEGA